MVHPGQQGLTTTNTIRYWEGLVQRRDGRGCHAEKAGRSVRICRYEMRSLRRLLQYDECNFDDVRYSAWQEEDVETDQVSNTFFG